MELTIGYHLLEGKMVNLKKPYAILEKQAGCSGDADPMQVDSAEEPPGSASSSVEYKVCQLPILLVQEFSHAWQPLL